jgi:phospholipid transport system substrate-binding protein
VVPSRVRPGLAAFCASVLVWVAGSAGVWASEPSDVVRDFFGAINVVLADPRIEDQPLARLRAIRRHVDEVFDFREAAMLALGREWPPRTAAEQNEFVALFADLLERSFVWRVAGKANLDGGVKVQYLGESVAGDTAAVDTTVTSRDGNDLRLEYRLVRRAGRWVVRDVVMDGVSTMENYHAQFQRVVRDGSWRDLMAQLRAKVGAPVADARVAAPPAVVGPATVVAAPVVPPLSPSDLGRPMADERPAATRDLAAVVTPGLAVRDLGTLPPRPPTSVVAEPITPAARAATIATEQATRTPAVSLAQTTADSRGGVTLAAVPPPPAEPLGVPKPLFTHPAARAAAYWVQVGAFRNAEIASRIAARVKGEIFVVADATLAGRHAEPLLRVRVGPFTVRAEAAARLRELKARGYQPFLAVD